MFLSQGHTALAPRKPKVNRVSLSYFVQDGPRIISNSAFLHFHKGSRLDEKKKKMYKITQTLSSLCLYLQSRAVSFCKLASYQEHGWRAHGERQGHGGHEIQRLCRETSWFIPPTLTSSPSGLWWMDGSSSGRLSERGDKREEKTRNSPFALSWLRACIH